jgi:hypothetical protein
MNKNLYKLNKKDLSQLDPGGAIKSAHDDVSQSLRIVNGITSVPSSYSRVELTYNSSGSVTKAVFYEGTLAQKTEIVVEADVAGSLNGTYITVYAENNEATYHIWFNVSNTGVDPAPANSVGIEVPIETNDSAEMVAFAIELVMRQLADFNVVKQGTNQIVIENCKKGAADLTTDSGTGFQITTIVQGSEKLLKALDIPFDGNVRYLFDVQDREFQVESIQDISVEVDADDGDNIAISGHQNPRIETFVATFVDTDLDEAAYTEVLSYTATEDLRIRKLNIKADTFGAFRIKVDGVIRDYFQTSPLHRNALFEFLEEEKLNTGQELTIEFVPDRICITNYEFFSRMEAYVK